MTTQHQDRDGSSRDLSTRTSSDELLHWLGALTVTGVRYLFTRVPTYRRDRFAEPERSLPDFTRELPGDPDLVQRVADGHGALYHRHFWIDFTDADLGPEELIDQLAGDLNAAAPGEMSSFDTGDDPDTSLAEGSELIVRLPGPWDGPVRVVDRTATSFRFATLRGHMEAGEIEFRAGLTERGYVRFEIETWARSGDERFRVLYDALFLGREAQAYMWTHFCQRAAKLAGGIIMSNVQVNTERHEEGSWLAEAASARPTQMSAPVSGRARRRLYQLSGRGLNFDPSRADAYTPETGWHIDDYRTALPAEQPGPPEPGGPWEIAREVCAAYEFPDPRVVRAVWFSDVPLAERELLVEGRFLFLRFLLGLRVGGVLDTTGQVDGRPVRRWGWDYGTLDGHLERGRMDFEVRKWLDTGEVEFRIHAYSQTAHIDNPVVRLGMWLFGRPVQVRFGHRAVARMRRIVEERAAERRHEAA